MRRALLALALLAAIGLAPGMAAPASATTVSGACTTNTGVTVVVDFGALGGGVQVHCDASATSGTSGLTALRSGFSTAGTNHDGPGFVCRIDGKPSVSQDPCINTPPATAYWSYWYASNGGSWTYSSKGAANHSVIVGGFEGWSWHSGSGANTPPTSGSPSHPVPAPGPKPTIKLGPAASTSTTGSSHSSSSSSTSKKPAATKTTATPVSPTSSASSTATGATPLATSTSADSAGGALAAESPDGGGSPWPLLGGISGIALIVAGAVVVVLRRRGAGGF